MATTVTVVRAYVNAEYFENTSSFYPFQATGSGGTRMAWVGDTVGAIGTFVGPDAIKAEANLLFNGSQLYPGVAGIDLGRPIVGSRFEHLYREADGSLTHAQRVHNNTAIQSNKNVIYRTGGTAVTATAAPANSIIQKDTYYVYDGSVNREAAEFIVEVDGTVSGEDFDVNMSWALRNGPTGSQIMMTLYPDLFTVVPAVRLSNLAGTGSRIVVADANGDLTATDAGTSKAVDYTSCAANATTNISIGATTDISFLLNYTANRNMGGAATAQQSGTIMVQYDSAVGAVSYSSTFIGNDLDFEIEADESGGVIRLNIIVSDVNVNALNFDYQIYSKFTA